ncbi:RNA polymerase-binding protein DksA [Ferrovum myxofaciens]|uniref:RNA polymerase-binding transcription factor DksA n=2 Tax=Ferrovum myxofaciens TaxID=416213 RepID=A0A149W1L0_9PROT|nr:RNA polymerase-binding transcription factor DksA [Ferrovum myxofaciens]
MNQITNAPDALLTLAEMLAAAAGDYMSARQLAFFRARLCQERDTLLAAASETTRHLQDFVTTPDPADRASLEEDHTLELRVRDRERKQLHKIDEALARIENGRYGWCEESGDPIGISRLLARPTATCCVEVQNQHESLRKRCGE